jgi:hypothetical protein
VIDTPGFDDSVRSDSDVVIEISSCLAAQVAMGVKLLGIIYIQDITVPRMRRSLKRELEMMKLIVGKRNYRHVLLVPSRAREFEMRQIDLEDNYWSDMIEGRATVHRFDGSTDSARAIVSQLNFGVAVQLELQRQLNSPRVTRFGDTDVGKFIEQAREQRAAELTQLGQRPASVADRIRQTEVQRSLELGSKDEAYLNFRMQDEVRVLVAEVMEAKKKSKQATSAAGIMSSFLAAARKRLSRPPEPKALPPLPAPITYR